MAFRLFPRSRKKGAPIQASIQVERYTTGDHRYEARPVRMTIRDREVSFDAQNFIAYGWSRRAARKRCLEKVIAYLKERAKIPEE